MSEGLECTGRKIRDIGKSDVYHNGYFSDLFEECVGGMSMTRNDCLVFINSVLDKNLPPLVVSDMDNDMLCEDVFYFVSRVCEKSIGPPGNIKGDFDIENTDWNFWRTVWKWRCFRNVEMDHNHVDELILRNIANFGRGGLQGGKSLESDEVTNAVWNGEEVTHWFKFDLVEQAEEGEE